MSVSRLFELVYLLLEKKRVTATELAQRFEVSVRTIYRDVDALSAAGVPVYAIPGKGGGVALMDHYVLDRAVFSEAEQRQLLTALQSLPENAQAAETLSKLSALFRQQTPDWLQVDLSRWGSNRADNAKFETLKNAILDRKIISFTYVSSGGQTTARRVLPARLVFKGQAWYLQGFCLKKSDYRTFKVTRILALQALEEQFSQTLDAPMLESDASSTLPFCIRVKLRFFPYMAYRVYDEFDEHCVIQEADGALTVEVLFPEDGWLYGYLLSFGLGVQVLSPPGLGERLGRLAEKIGQANLIPDTRCQGMDAKIEASQQQEEKHMEQQFCQSCGMPLSQATPGTEQDGTPNPHYCSYCYQGGAFTNDFTMEQMIAFCAPIMSEGNPGMTSQQATAQMQQFFPMLLRWKK